MWGKQIDWRAKFDEIGARRTDNVWRFASGRYSDVKYDMDYLFRDPDLYSRACKDLLKKAGLRTAPRDFCFVFPERGGIPMSFELARQSGARAGYSIKKGSKFELEACFKPDQRHTVCLGDDVITTGGSIVKTREAIGSPGPLYHHKVLAFVNRTGNKVMDLIPQSRPVYFHLYEIISLLETNEPTWSPTDPDIPPHILKQIVTV